MLMEFIGLNGQLELYEDKIIFKRKGVMSKLSQGFTKGDKTIYIKQISGIDLKLGGNLINGYIQFTLPGGNEKRGGAFQATQDENTMMFKKKDNDFAIKIKEKVEDLMKSNSVSKPSISVADEIKKYKELFNEGIITEEEFDIKKKQLLDL